MTLEKIIQFVADLIAKGFTGAITINFYKGNLSHKIEKKIFETID